MMKVMKVVKIIKMIMKIKNKSAAVVICVAVFLTGAVVVLGIINYEQFALRRALLEYGAFSVTAGGYTHAVSMEDLLTVGAVSVSATARGETRNFTGVPLADIFAHLGISGDNAGSVLFTSLDGFATAVSIADALDGTNAFIVFEEDGQPLGTREEGGLGPYMLVMARDQFPNRWARYLMEITVQ